MKYVLVDNEGYVISDVKQLTEERVSSLAGVYKSVEGLDPVPSQGDRYVEDSNSFIQGTRRTLDAIEARQIRDTYLSNSDWIVQSASEGAFEGNSNFNLQEWIDFRQALRTMEMPGISETVEYTSSLFPARPMYPMGKT